MTIIRILPVITMSQQVTSTWLGLQKLISQYYQGILRLAKLAEVQDRELKLRMTTPRVNAWKRMYKNNDSQKTKWHAAIKGSLSIRWIHFSVFHSNPDLAQCYNDPFKVMSFGKDKHNLAFYIQMVPS